MCGFLFFSKKHGFLGLTPVYSETTGEKIPAKTLAFQETKVNSTGYYGIEDPFPDLISKLRHFRGDAECQLLVVKSHW